MIKNFRRLPATTRPYNVFDALSDINRWFDPVSRDLTNQNQDNMMVADWAPSIDIRETPEQYVIKADVPGVDPKHIMVDMENNLLTIKGEKETQLEEKEKDYVRIERVKGTFMRQFTLPDAVDGDNISAKCKHGVLEVLVPKAKKSLSRKIKIEE